MRSLRLFAMGIAIGMFFEAISTAENGSDPIRSAYERAAFIENNEQNGYYLNRFVVPHWIADSNAFWYRKETGGGTYRFVLVNATNGQKSDLLDHDHLADLLQNASGMSVASDALPLRGMKVSQNGALTFNAFGKGWLYDPRGGITETGKFAEISTWVVSPQGDKAAFIRDFNLWIKDLTSGEERPLTLDGTEHYAYALPSHAIRIGGRAEALWSSDGAKLLTLQTDDRQVLDVPVTQFAPPGGVRPITVHYKQPHPGDAHIPTYRMLVIDLATGAETAIHYPNVPAVRMLDTPINGGRAWWSADGKTAYFVDIERGERKARIIAADASTGEAREVFQETRMEGSLELGQSVYMPSTLKALPMRDQLIWYSERSGYPHLYLIDLKTGELVRALTSGEFIVRDLLHVDESEGEALISIASRDRVKNPYYQEVAKVDLDTGEMTVLSEGDDDRQVIGLASFELIVQQYLHGTSYADASGVSPSGDYWVETATRVDRPSRTVVRGRDGKEIALLEEAQTVGLPDGFSWPEPILLTAADGQTQIQAIVCRPSDFSPDQSYPIIDHIYGGPQIANVPTSFTLAATRCQAIAELGFIGVVIDGRGTTGRGRAFHETSYGAVEKASDLEDHIAALRQLAARYSYMDIDRVGIFGFSGGGYMTASAMMRFPDFFHVGVAASGNHDQRLFLHGWGERYQGLMDGDNYLAQANPTYANRLEGKLLLIHGMMDVGVHPAAMFQLVQALIDANKDFDLVLLPRAAHELPGYGLRRQWDYFVTHLRNQIPPTNFLLENSIDTVKTRIGLQMVGVPVDSEETE